ncbi:MULTISPECIES: M20/M25/M40 family metallo-hydrolase [unclassified Sphingomonas]|uniref:M20/M25/M40 family metallo-hydrolase n=1 Tax=unclassified Sphingomonas TaxID=196159 RepID=UPI0006F9A5B4|nr:MULTISPECIES: M20/M25/M40 family metallo-hydrolase [unclassified Sphingomonas]KQX17822.1 peptidase M28 [Sphingomonas sp. Root1294]KQY70748.1 peptidase M28 [Sphingomonas sp. Root50]KRB91759.1 peptidase M28 [Sphingomonas sp. Root720]
MHRTIALVAAVAGALIWAIIAVLPPAPRGADAPLDAFSAGRAFADVAAISQAPRPVGSPGHARTLAYLTARLHGLGAEVSEQAVPLKGKSLARLHQWSGRPEKGVVARNLIGVIPGRDRAKPALMLMAHHDSVWGSPGAGDDAMAVAAALEVARAIGARGRPERDLILLFTDSEEIGLDGSIAFFDRHPLARRTGAIINMEARGAGGRANMFETGPGNGAMMRLYADQVDRPATNSLSVLIYDLMPNYTDYTIAKRKGIAGFNLAVLDRGYAYHSPLATVAALDPASLQDMGDQALALASALAFATEMPARSENAAFSDLLGRVTIVYPASTGWALLAIAAALIGLALRRHRPSFGRVGGGAVLVGAILLHGALLLTAINALSGSGGANYYDRLAALPRLETIAGLLVAALLLLVPLARRTEPPMLAIAPAMAVMWAGVFCDGPLVTLLPLGISAMLAAWFLPDEEEGGPVAAILLLLLAGIVVQALQPTAGPLFHWPLLLGAVALAARAWLPARAGLATTALCMATGVGHLLAQAHFIFLGIGAELPAVMMVLLFAGLPLILPLLPRAVPRWIPAGALAAALIVALWVRLDPIAPSIPVYSLSEGGKKTRD